MKKPVPVIFICLLALIHSCFAQCPAGYTKARLKWDNLDYYYNGGIGAAPYGSSGGTYVTNAMEQSQKFTIGTASISFNCSAAGIVKGKNTRHTGNLTNYAGADAHFIPTANGQTITLDFSEEVSNVSFVLYDIDGGSSLTLTGVNATAVPQTISASLQPTTLLTVTGNNSASLLLSSTATDAANTVNDGSATITLAGAVKTIVLTVTNKGTDPKFWLSDIYACVPGSFPLDYHKMASGKPFTGQPDYLLTTPDNNSIYKVDPATGKAWFLFAEPSSTYINSFAYDQANHILYYTTDGTGSPSSNKQLKKYDFNTDVASVVLADVSASLNLPTFDQGVESAAAAFYDGKLYLGIEGGKYYNSNATRYTDIYRMDLDATGKPVNAAQVIGIQAYDSVSGNSLHDWGDFLVKDGLIIDFNTARQGTSTYTYPNSSFLHYDMMNDSVHNYINPTPSAAYAGQAGLDWAGNMYSLRTGLQKYNMTGGIGTNIPITVIRGPAWRGNSGDASEPFKPKMDFGDAPSSYDPSTGDPAVHEMDSAIKLGNNFDTEWIGRGSTALANSDNFDDGLTTVPVLSSGGSYVANISVFNNTGSTATVCAWLDWNANGKFDAAEGITRSVITKTTQQTVTLSWSGITTVPPNGSYTYLRIRITYASNNMGTSNPTGYYGAGEVEDYRVPVSTFPLSTHLVEMNASLLEAGSVKVDWSLADETGIEFYTVEKSSDEQNWNFLQSLSSGKSQGTASYTLFDPHPFQGVSYYRVRMVYSSGRVELTQPAKVETYESSIMAFSALGSHQLSVLIDSRLDHSETMISMYNSQGIKLLEKQVRIQKGMNKIFIPLGSIPRGHYVASIITDNRAFNQSIILQ